LITENSADWFRRKVGSAGIFRIQAGPDFPHHYRILKRAGLSGCPGSDPVDRRRFEAEFPNDIWQSDVMHCPQVLVDGKKRKSYLIAFLDDHSRLIPHGAFYLSENLVSWLEAFAAPWQHGACRASSMWTMGQHSAPGTWKKSAPAWASP
jgi:hypothetical protein